MFLRGKNMFFCLNPVQVWLPDIVEMDEWVGRDILNLVIIDIDASESAKESAGTDFSITPNQSILAKSIYVKRLQ